MKITYKSKLITLEIEQASNILICKCIHFDENLYKFIYQKQIISYSGQHKINFITGKYFEFICNTMYIPPKCEDDFIFIINCDYSNTAKFCMKNLLSALHKLYEEYLINTNKFYNSEKYIKNLTKEQTIKLLKGELNV